MEQQKICSRFLKPAVRKLGIENIRRSSNLFLNGYPVWLYFDGEEGLGIYHRLLNYLGHGFCYEFSAIEMMIWKDAGYPQRFVYADCGRNNSEKVGHCWFEIKRFGVWWAFDPAWFRVPVAPMLAGRHARLVEATNARALSAESFWSRKTFRYLYSQMQSPETSYMFYYLATARTCKSPEGGLVIDFLVKKDELVDLDSPLWPLIYSLHSLRGSRPGTPVTQRIINEFAVNPRRINPKAKTYRRALAETREIRRKYEEYRAKKAQVTPEAP